MASPLSPADLIAIVKRDPGAAFVAIPMFSIKAGRAVQTVMVNPRGKNPGRAVDLPQWTGDEWIWYAGIAFAIAKQVLTDVGPERGAKVRKRLETLEGLEPAMQALGTSIAPAAVVGPFYTATVQAVLEAVSIRGAPSTFDLILGSFPSGPDDVKQGLADALAVGADAFRALGRTAKKLLDDAFKGLTGISIGTALIIGVGLWYLSRKRRGREED